MFYATSTSDHGYRYDSSDLGRWVSKDPIEEWSTANLYVYTANGPIHGSDPDGCTVVSLPIRRRGMPIAVAVGAESTLERRLLSLCPPQGDEIEMNTTEGTQCCGRTPCEQQARAFAMLLWNAVDEQQRKEFEEHGNVIGGWAGNYRRQYGVDWHPFGIGPDAGSGEAGPDGLYCNEWLDLVSGVYDRIIKPQFKRKEGCFAFAGVQHSDFPVFARGVPLGWGFPSSRLHVWGALYGPQSPGIRLDITAADLYIDPWPSGGLRVLPKHNVVPELAEGRNYGFMPTE